MISKSVVQVSNELAQLPHDDIAIYYFFSVFLWVDVLFVWKVGDGM